MAFITEWNHTAGNFTLPLRSGYTYNMVVDWGDGSPTSTVTAYNSASATHNYTVAGTYQISITGTCGAFYINNSATIRAKLKKILDWGAVSFGAQGLVNAFYGCNNLNTLPAGAIPYSNLTSLAKLFQSCTSLTSIPANIFDTCTLVTTFDSVFYGCTGITSIPTDLFRYNTAVAASGFNATFRGCTGITSIPVDLFRYNTAVSTSGFASTFQSCTGLTSIPVDLFRYNTNARDFNTCFYGCTGLTSIPATLFDANTLATSFSNAFYNCVGITSIPTDLFRYNTAVTNFSYIFYGCTGITSIPTDLFRYNTLTTDFSDIFRGCTNITSIPTDFFKYNTAATNFQEIFNSCSKITAIPVDLFRYNTLANNFLSAFSGCSMITSIPTDLFRYNTAVTNFQDVFRNCSKITAIPEDLFRYNTLVTSFSSAFNGCSLITSIPVDLFRYNTAVTNFYNTFGYCSNLQSVPENLFRYNTAATNFTDCFRECIKLPFNKNIFYSDGEQATRFLNKSVNFSDCFNKASHTGSQGSVPDLWNCSFGTGTPTITGCYAGAGNNKTSVSNYCYIPTTYGATRCARLETIGAGWHSATQEKITVTTSIPIPAPDTFQCYVGPVLAEIENPANLVTLTQIENTIYNAIAPTPGDNSTWYVKIKYSEPGGVNPETLSYIVTHYQVAPIPTTIINITNPDDYIVFDDPKHSLNHGSIHYNGYIYGTSRNWWKLDGGGYWSTCIFKVKADNYSIVNQETYYLNRSIPDNNEILANLEQVVFCAGFLWAQANNSGNGYLIRINPDDLSEVIFSGTGGTFGQPIGTDGTNLFITTDSQVNKYNVNLLTGTPESLGYYGTGPVTLPASTILASCNIINLHPNFPPYGAAYSHSILIDNSFIYLAVTTTTGNGYDSDLDVYYLHLQKINKTTMITAGDVVIPRCTDDITHNENYIFLCPEFIYNDGLPILGHDWGLLAVNKSTLEIKYLKALSREFNTSNPLDRGGYGVFLFQNKIAVQLTLSKKTVIINTSDIESWGPDFPIGGATEAIYKFQLNGVDMAAPCNELVMDNAGYIHTNTWEENTILFKFTFQNIFPQNNNALTLFHNSAQALIEYLNPKRGHSIRCVQDAPGIADLTTGTATDQDGNEYDTIVINEKRWFVQNLKTTIYRDGSVIPNISDNTEWSTQTDGALSSYDNESETIYCQEAVTTTTTVAITTTTTAAVTTTTTTSA